MFVAKTVSLWVFFLTHLKQETVRSSLLRQIETTATRPFAIWDFNWFNLAFPLPLFHLYKYVHVHKCPFISLRMSSWFIIVPFAYPAGFCTVICFVSRSDSRDLTGCHHCGSKESAGSTRSWIHPHNYAHQISDSSTLMDSLEFVYRRNRSPQFALVILFSLNCWKIAMIHANFCGKQ